MNKIVIRAHAAIRSLALGLLAFVASLGSAAPALAQEFVKVDIPVQERLPHAPFVAVAYGFIWVAVLAYVVIIARGLAGTRGDIEDLRRKVAELDKR